jgi:hypothetical protein
MFLTWMLTILSHMYNPAVANWLQCSNGFGAGKPNRGAITTPFVWCIEFGLKAWHYLVPALQTVEPDQL